MRGTCVRLKIMWMNPKPDRVHENAAVGKFRRYKEDRLLRPVSIRYLESKTCTFSR